MSPSPPNSHNILTNDVTKQTMLVQISKPYRINKMVFIGWTLINSDEGILTPLTQNNSSNNVINTNNKIFFNEIF